MVFAFAKVKVKSNVFNKIMALVSHIVKIYFSQNNTVLLTTLV